MIHPLKKIYITQDWGVNPDSYARFGLKGHNGVDYRLFDKNGNRATEADVYAPHDGEVIETGYDANGYGYYIKIENSKEGSILAHLKSFAVKVGDYIAEGQLLGVADNSGNSIGAHLHWGYYPKPRYRDNGYSGTINQLPLLENQTKDPSPPSDVEMLPKNSVVHDFLEEACLTTSDNEKKAYSESNKNLRTIFNEVFSGNDRFYKKWVKPSVDKAILENDQKWHSLLESANAKLENCKNSKVEELPALYLIKIGLTKLLAKGGETE